MPGWGLPFLIALGARMLLFSFDVNGERAYVMTWAICAAAFVLVTPTELLVTRWMPDAWKEAFVKTFHVRRIYRNYGP